MSGCQNKRSILKPDKDIGAFTNQKQRKKRASESEFQTQNNLQNRQWTLIKFLSLL